MVYFVGPSDVARALELQDRAASKDSLGALREKLLARYPEHFAGDDKAEALDAAVRFYGLRASVSYSSGAHDEWNIVRRMNEVRRAHAGNPSDQIAVYFDGRAASPAESETKVSAGTSAEPCE